MSSRIARKWREASERWYSIFRMFKEIPKELIDIRGMTYAMSTYEYRRFPPLWRR